MEMPSFLANDSETENNGRLEVNQDELVFHRLLLGPQRMEPRPFPFPGLPDSPPHQPEISCIGSLKRYSGASFIKQHV